MALSTTNTSSPHALPLQPPVASHHDGHPGPARHDSADVAERTSSWSRTTATDDAAGRDNADHTAIPAPSQFTRRLIHVINNLEPLRPLTGQQCPWTAGAAVHPGLVRSRNEDFAVSFAIDQLTVGLVADGCGGIPHGREAAYKAVRGASVSLARQLAWIPRSQQPPGLCGVALQAIYEASDTLTDFAECAGIDPGRSLRCTLLVVLVTEDEVHYAYLGDGAIHHYRPSSDELTTLLTPQRVEGYSNVLTASLGARIEGEPVHGRIDRRRGDFVWLSSDGVADRTDPHVLSRALNQEAIRRGGDLQAVVQDQLEAFAHYQDEGGLVFDDNLSLVLIADPAPDRTIEGPLRAVRDGV